MQNIIALISFELNDQNLTDAWKKMSDEITKSLQGVDGFIYRDSAIGEDGKVYCILKWESEEKQLAFKKTMETEAFQEKMKDFGKFVNMATMKSEVLKVV